MRRRILSILTALALCLSLCPTWAFAAEGGSEPADLVLNVGELTGVQQIAVNGNTVSMDGGEMRAFSTLVLTGTAENLLIKISHSDQVTLRDLHIDITRSDMYGTLLDLYEGSSVRVEGTVTLASSGSVIVGDSIGITGPGSLMIDYSGTDTAVLFAQGISIGGDLSISAPNGCPTEVVSGYVCPITAQNITLTHGQDWTPNALNLNAAEKLTINGQAIAAKVTPAEETQPLFSYLTAEALDNAFADSGNTGATFTLLADVERTEPLQIRITCVLDLGGHTICCEQECLTVHCDNTGAPLNVTIRGEGKVISTNNTALIVWGNVTLKGGTFTSNGGDFGGVYVNNPKAKLSVTGESVIIQNTGGGYGLAVNNAQSVQLSAGTYFGGKGSIVILNSFTLGNLLPMFQCAYFDENGAPIIGKLGDHALTGTVTVKECNHTGDGVCEYTPNEGAETHAMICLACGRAEAEEACTYSGEYEHDETNHWQTCTLCGRKKTGTHSYGSWEPEYNENAVTIRRSCENCGYTKTDGTFTVPAPGQTMQYGKPITLTCSSTLPGATFSWSLNENPADVTGDRFTPPGTLAVGIYRCDVTVKWPGSESNICTKTVNFGVTPAPLTATAATAESRPYNGSNLVEITSVTLDGILNDDDVSVATTGLSGTLSGSNAGSYTNLTLPAMTLTGGAASNYTLTPPAGAVPASVTIEKAPALTLTPNPGDLAVANGRAHTYTYGLGALRPDVQEGMSLGSTAVTYELGTVSLGSYYDSAKDGAKIEGQTLTLTIEAVQNDKAEEIGTVTVIIHTQNFEDMTATIKVRSVNKIIPTGGPTLSANALTYGQALSAITLSGSMQDNGAPVPGTFAWSNPDNRPAVQESYAAAWTFTPADNNKYAIVTGTALIQVLPAPIAGAVIVLDHTAFKYDGQPHGPGIASVTLEGTALTADVDYTAEIPEGIEAGTYTVMLTGKGSYTGTATAVFRINPVETMDIPQEDDTGKKLKLEVETGISQIPAALQNNEELNSPAKIEEKMKTVLTAADTSIPEENTEVYDAALLVSTDGGTSWEKATADNFPSGGLTITLPYPEGTGRDTHDFVVTHMFTTADFGRTPGETEQPEITKTAEGIRFTVTGLSPIAVAWKDITVEPTPTPTPPSGGSYWTGGGSGPSTTYAVTVEKVEHGTVTASRVNAASGSTVTLTVTPDAGYVLDTLTVTDSRGSEVKLTGKGNGKYTFTMPDRAVTVKAVFAPLPEDAEQGDRLQPCDGGVDCPSRGFADLGSVGTWYHEAVDYVLRNGLMNGYSDGTFGPNDPLSRAQFAQILYNKEGRPAVTVGSTFPDVAEGAWYAGAVRWASSRGIIGGYGNGMFGPDDNITREQLAVMLWRYAGSPAATDKELHFTDADRASGYALKALRWAVENGIMSGKGGGMLDPKGRATRAQTAQMVENFVTR